MMGPKMFIVSCYNLLMAANGMSSEDATMDDATWARQDGGIYGGIYQAYVQACDQVYGDLSSEIRERVSRSFGDDLNADDLDQMAREIQDERYNEAVSHAMAVASDALHEARHKMNMSDNRRDLLSTIYNLVTTLTYGSDGDDAQVLAKADEVKRFAEMRARGVS